MRQLWLRFYPYDLWLILAIPAITMIMAAISSSNPTRFHDVLHPSGEFAARFLIVAMIATPLTILLRGWGGPQWLRRNRRYLGVSAFGYSFLHTVFYLLDKKSITLVWADFSKFYIWTGWAAFVIFLPLVMTSHDWFLCKMRRWWKWLQRWTYAAAILTFLHWCALYDWAGVAPAFGNFGLLMALQAYRVRYWICRSRAPEPNR